MPFCTPGSAKPAEKASVICQKMREKSCNKPKPFNEPKHIYLSQPSGAYKGEAGNETAAAERPKTSRQALRNANSSKRQKKEAARSGHSAFSSSNPKAPPTSTRTSAEDAHDSATTIASSITADGEDSSARHGALSRFGHGLLRFWSNYTMTKRKTDEKEMEVSSATGDDVWAGEGENQHEYDEGDRNCCMRIVAEPYNWPHEGSPYALSSSNTALVIIDMQKDFLSPEGYLAQQGTDIASARTIIPHVQELLACCRKASFPIYHTREGHRRGLSTMSSQQRFRSRRANSSGLGMGDRGPLGRLLVRGEEGHDIIDELRPYEGDENGIGEEPIIDKPARSAFNYTDFQLLLDVRGVKNLIICGVTTDQCVLSTMRDANDKGFDCLLVEDACWAEPSTHIAVIEMVKAEGGILGAVTTKNRVLRAIERDMSCKTALLKRKPFSSLSSASSETSRRDIKECPKVLGMNDSAAERKPRVSKSDRDESVTTCRRSTTPDDDSSGTEYLETLEPRTLSTTFHEKTNHYAMW